MQTRRSKSLETSRCMRGRFWGISESISTTTRSYSHVSATSSRQSEGGAVGDTGRNVLAEDDAWSQKGGGDERDGEVEHFGSE
jgi:hypothetical protein